jgi:glycogen operon protein
VFRRRDFFVGDEVVGSGLPDVVWLRPDGEEMTDEDWSREDAHMLGVFLNGHEIPTHDRDGNPVRGASFAIFFNAHHEPAEFRLPERLGERWSLEISTDDESSRSGEVAAGEPVPVSDRSVVVLRRLESD